MSKLLIPLYYRPVNLEIGLPSNVVLDPDPEEGAVLITRDNLDELRGDLQDHNTPRFHLFDTVAEAKAALLLLSSEGEGRALNAQVGQLRDGEGVLMLEDPNRHIGDDRGFTFTDHRSEICRDRAVSGSWALSGPECEEALGAMPGLHRSDLANAIAWKISAFPSELVRDLQVALEMVPGAYVGFVSVSPEEVRADYRLDGVGPERAPDALIQACLSRASTKAELGEALNEAVDATVERLLATRPDLISDDPEP